VCTSTPAPAPLQIVYPLPEQSLQHVAVPPPTLLLLLHSLKSVLCIPEDDGVLVLHHTLTKQHTCMHTRYVAMNRVEGCWLARSADHQWVASIRNYCHAQTSTVQVPGLCASCPPPRGTLPSPLICMLGRLQVTLAPSEVNLTQLSPLWLPFTLLPWKEALQQLLPVYSNCTVMRGMRGPARPRRGGSIDQRTALQHHTC
jgi:hypothetical protein